MHLDRPVVLARYYALMHGRPGPISPDQGTEDGDEGARTKPCRPRKRANEAIGPAKASERSHSCQNGSHLATVESNEGARTKPSLSKWQTTGSIAISTTART